MSGKPHKRKDIKKSEYKARVSELRTKLLLAQQAVREHGVPVIVLFAGVDGAGKHETVDLLNEWMDPRLLRTCAYGPPSEEERERPAFWRYWRDQPPAGQIGLFLSAWYSVPLLEQVKGISDEKLFQTRLTRINHYEKTLADNGALILKFYMHLGQKEQLRRLRKLAADSLTSWEVRPKDWEHWALYDRFMEVSEHLVKTSDQPHARWHMIDASAERRRGLDVAETILEAIESRVAMVRKQADTKPARPRRPRKHNVLDRLKMDRQLEKEEYRRQLVELRARLGRLQRQAHQKRFSSIFMLEGWDAGGKGGAIRRITSALDARNYQVIPVAAPTDEEKAHHYLWRFWRHIPRNGRVTIYDRSWYGRVLVERIEGYCNEDAWKRAYDEINQFESELVDDDIILCKFWIHISQNEQLRRFREREKIPYKKWKITEEDYRNRAKWDEYVAAVDDMVRKTSTTIAPWTLIEGNQKYYARIKVLRTVCEAMEARLS